MSSGVGENFNLDETELKEFASEFASKLKPGDSIGLIGQLGAGKTTFVRYVVEALGCKVPASSPTYVLCHDYSVDEKAINIEHWDLYRLNGLPEELWERKPDSIRLIEWSDKFPELKEHLNIEVSFSFDVGAENRRQVRINT